MSAGHLSITGEYSWLSYVLTRFSFSTNQLRSMSLVIDLSVSSTFLHSRSTYFVLSRLSRPILGHSSCYSLTQYNSSLLISDRPSGPKPILVVNVTNKIIAGDHVSFTCTTEDINSNPQLIIVKWTKNGEDCEWPETAFNHTTQVSTTGSYSCKVGNVINGTHAYSQASEPVELKVKEENGKANTILFFVI